MARCALKRSLRPGLLLQRRGHERRGRRAPEGALGHRAHGEGLPGQRARRPRWPPPRRGRGPRSCPSGLPARRSPCPVATAVPPRLTRAAPKPAGGGRVGERAVDPPPGGGAEPHAGPLALDHHPRGHALHPAGRQAGHDLAPQHRRDLVAVEAVEDAPRLLGVDQAAVEVAPLVDGAGDRRGRDLVEHHPLHRHGRLQHLGEMPRDRLALAVFVRRQVELVGSLEELLQVRHHRLLRRRDDVERLEAVVDVDAEARPRLALVARPGPRRPRGAGRGCARPTTRR